jgi:glutamate dehydrogenase/leucine dehydrogenase
MCLKPGIKCGIPHELGSTGFGVAKAAAVACGFSNLKLAKSSITVAGFGNVGSFAASFLAETGAKIVAVSDSTGTIYNQNGLDINKIKIIKHDQKTITRYQPAKVFPADEIFNLTVDILIPSALGDVIFAKNMKDVKAKIIVEGANLPISVEAEEFFYNNKILVIPDIVANAGGVISSYAEYRGYDPAKMFKMVEKKIISNTKKVLILSKENNINPRHAALLLANQRLKLAKR